METTISYSNFYSEIGAGMPGLFAYYITFNMEFEIYWHLGPSLAPFILPNAIRKVSQPRYSKELNIRNVNFTINPSNVIYVLI